MAGVIQEIINYLTNPELISPSFFSAWQVLRLIFIYISIILGALIIFLLSVNGYIDARYKANLEEFTKVKPYRNFKVNINWVEITKAVKEGKEADRRLAVIEADDAVNSALGQLGYQGNNLLEKLERINKDIIPNIEDLKRAHKIKRDVVYDPSRGLSHEEAREMIAIYEKTFQDLQLL